MSTHPQLRFIVLDNENRWLSSEASFEAAKEVVERFGKDRTDPATEFYIYEITEMWFFKSVYDKDTDTFVLAE